MFVDYGDGRLMPTAGRGARFDTQRTAVQFTVHSTGANVGVTCPNGQISRVVLRWEKSFPVDALFLGGHWERGYGVLQWRHPQPDRVMPWYFAAHHPATGKTFMAGVRTQPSAICFWMVDAVGVSL